MASKIQFEPHFKHYFHCNHTYANRCCMFINIKQVFISYLTFKEYLGESKRSTVKQNTQKKSSPRDTERERQSYSIEFPLFLRLAELNVESDLYITEATCQNIIITMEVHISGFLHWPQPKEVENFTGNTIFPERVERTIKPMDDAGQLNVFPCLQSMKTLCCLFLFFLLENGQSMYTSVYIQKRV